MEAFRPRRHDLTDPFDREAFKASPRASCILAGDPRYDEARQVKNMLFDRHPSMIVKAAGQGDVVQTIVYASEAGLELSVRGGCHSLAGHSHGRRRHRPRPERHEGRSTSTPSDASPGPSPV